MSKLDQIEALINKVDGQLPFRKDEECRAIVRLELNKVERNLIADALTVLYGLESKRRP